MCKAVWSYIWIIEQWAGKKVLWTNMKLFTIHLHLSITQESSLIQFPKQFKWEVKESCMILYMNYEQWQEKKVLWTKIKDFSMHLHLSLLHKLVLSFNSHITESDGKLYDPSCTWTMTGKKFYKQRQDFLQCICRLIYGQAVLDKLVDSFS